MSKNYSFYFKTSYKSLLALIIILIVNSSFNNASINIQFINDEMLAEVSTKKITVFEFRKFLTNNFQSCGRIAKLSLSNVNLYLDSLINSTLILCEAEFQNLESDSSFIERINRFQTDAIFNRLIEYKVLDSIITKNKLKEFYKKYGGEIQLRQILIREKNDSIKSKILAEKIYNDINNGLDFKIAAEKYSQDMVAANNDGEMGFARWGQLSKQVQEIAFELNPGEISTPIKTPFGYYIIKVISKVKCGYENEYRELKYQLAAVYASTIEHNKKIYLNLLLEKYGVKFFDYNIKQIVENAPSSYHQFKPIPKNLLEIPLVSYKGGSINLDNFIKIIGTQNITKYLWDEINLFKKLSLITINRIAVLEAKNLGLDVIEDVKRYKDQQLIALMIKETFSVNIQGDELLQYNDNYKEAKGQIKAALLNNKKQLSYNEWITNLKRKFKVTINNDVFNEFIKDPLNYKLSLN